MPDILDEGRRSEKVVHRREDFTFQLEWIFLVGALICSRLGFTFTFISEFRNLEHLDGPGFLLRFFFVQGVGCCSGKQGLNYGTCRGLSFIFRRLQLQNDDDTNSQTIFLSDEIFPAARKFCWENTHTHKHTQTCARGSGWELWVGKIWKTFFFFC